MRILSSEKGAALITALMLTVLALVISATLLYTVTMGTRITASHRRYRTALAATHGGAELFTAEIIPRLLLAAAQDDPGHQLRDKLLDDYSLINLTLPQYDCLRKKIDSPTSEWSPSCSTAQSSSDPMQQPDVTFRLRSDSLRAPGYRVFTKIVDTVPGNTDKSSLDLDAGSGVAGRDEVIHPKHVPAIYSLYVQGVREGHENEEKARLSVLYAY